MYVVITTDRGLCGGVNSQVTRQVRTAARELMSAGHDMQVFIVVVVPLLLLLVMIVVLISPLPLPLPLPCCCVPPFSSQMFVCGEKGKSQLMRDFGKEFVRVIDSAFDKDITFPLVRPLPLLCVLCVYAAHTLPPSSVCI